MISIFFAARTVHLLADPPSDLSWSGGLYGDEFMYAHNARNKVLFGKWVTDDWNPYLFNPILTFFDFASFSILGTGFKALRMVPLLWAGLSMVLFFWALYLESRSLLWTFIGFCFLEANYFFLMYTRISLSDAMLTNWMILSLFLWVLGKRYKVAMFFSAFASVGVFSCKPTAIYFLAILFASYVFHFSKEKRGSQRDENVPFKECLVYGVKRTFPFILGTGLAGLIWLVLFYIPNHDEISRFSASWKRLAMPRDMGEYVSRVFGKYSPIVFKHFRWFPFILLLAWLYFPISFYRFVIGSEKITAFEVLILGWFIIGYFAVSGLHYRPPRYFISLVPPVAILAWLACRFFYELEYSEVLNHKIFSILFGAWICLTVFLGRKYIHFEKSEGFIVLGLAVVIVSVSVVSRFLTQAKKRFRLERAVIILSFLVISLFHNVKLYAKWVAHPTFDEINTSRRVGELVKNGVS